MKEIFLQPYDIWDYFERHMEELRDKPLVAASNNDAGVEIYISAPIFGSTLTLSVAEDDEIVDEIEVGDGVNCAIEATELYKLWLTKEFAFGDEPWDTVIDQKLAIEERESDLDSAIEDLLFTVLEKADYERIMVDADEVKDHICEYLYKEFDANIYRPMYLENEDGTEEFCEFPYEEMDLEDE